MTDDTTTAKPGAETTGPEWSGAFDADRARATITKLRDEVRALKAERDEARQDATAADEARMTAEGDRDTARRDLWVERAMREHGLPAESVRFLTGETEDAVKESAAALALMRTTPAAHTEDDADTTGATGPTSSLSSRPEPRLMPGHGGETPPSFDAEAVARRGRRR